MVRFYYQQTGIAQKPILVFSSYSPLQDGQAGLQKISAEWGE
jgi:hypothetical protein